MCLAMGVRPSLREWSQVVDGHAATHAEACPVLHGICGAGRAPVRLRRAGASV
jgi:hypothetical protein